MKKILPLLNWLMLCSMFIYAQLPPVNDSIALGAGYSDLSFYSMANGETAYVNAKDWDLQFGTKLMEASIRVNDGAGVMLYRLQNPDTTAWMSVDTTGMTALYNSDSNWDYGAFNADAFSTGPTDFGWGIYNQVAHNIDGNRIFVIKTINGNYKKIWVKKLTYGVTYDILIANLDNSGEEAVVLARSNYPGKEFFYYAIDSAQAKDIEPAKNDWDVVFRRYQTYVSFPPPAQYYTVTGVLSAPDVTVAEARNVNVNVNDTTGFEFENDISVIGSDWKNFNQTTFQYTMVDSLVYFVAAHDGNIYKLQFTGFAGSSTGKVFFTKTQLTQNSTGIEESTIQSLAVYPNPATENVHVLFFLQGKTDVSVKIFDVAGKIHFNSKHDGQTGLNNLMLNTNAFSQGFYLLSVDDGNNNRSYRFVKN